MSSSHQLDAKFQAKVGLFVGGGLFAAALSIIMLGGDRISFSRAVEFKTHLTEVPGLFVGSTVSFSGLKVGNVARIEFTEQQKIELTLNVDPQFASRLTEGALVEVRTQGALGDKYIYIKPGRPDGKVLESGALLPADESDFLKLLTDREDGMARAVDLVKELHILIASINQDRKLTKAVSNVSDVTEQLKGTITRLDRILDGIGGVKPEDQKLKQAMTSLARILEKVDKGQGTLGQLINDPSVYQSLKGLVGANQRSTFVKELMRETIDSEPKKESGRKK